MTIYDYNNSRSSMPTMEQHKVGTCKAKTNERWTRIVTTRELCSLQTSDTQQWRVVASSQADVCHDKSGPVCFILSARGGGGSELEKNQIVMNGLHERCVYPRSATGKTKSRASTECHQSEGRQQ